MQTLQNNDEQMLKTFWIIGEKVDKDITSYAKKVT